MKITELDIPGLLLIENYIYEDRRGLFVKTFNSELFKKHGIDNIQFKEIYYSLSCKNTIRGMHFQLPPADHAKFIYVTNGAVIDVILDIRKSQNGYGNYTSIKLEANKNGLYIPSGCAHGFKSLYDNTLMVYNQTSVYNSQFDCGIHYNSFGYNWQVINPIVSKRDKELQHFKDIQITFE